MEEVSFVEEQRFVGPRSRYVLAATAAASLVLVLNGLSGMETGAIETGPRAVGLVSVFLLVGMGVPALFFALKLTVEVRSEGLYIHYRPFIRQVIPYESIQRCRARDCRPLAEYGGWGIRRGWRKGAGKAYTVWGNRGVELEFWDDKKLLIGSRDADRLETAIRSKM